MPVTGEAGQGYLLMKGFRLSPLMFNEIGFVGHAPYWNGFGFPAPYVAVTILDTAIGWTLAGLAVAKFVPGRT